MGTIWVKSADPYRDPYADSIQWTRHHKPATIGFQLRKFRETFRISPTKYSAPNLCRSNNDAHGAVTRQHRGLYLLVRIVSCCFPVTDPTEWYQTFQYDMGCWCYLSFDCPMVSVIYMAVYRRNEMRSLYHTWARIAIKISWISNYRVAKFLLFSFL